MTISSASPWGICRATRTDVGGFSLSVWTYPPGLRMPRHAHEAGKISIVVAGGAEETAAARRHECGAGGIALKPGGAEHEDHVGPSGLTTLVVRRSGTATGAALDWQTALSEYRWVHGGPAVRPMLGLFSRLSAWDGGCAEEAEEAIYELLRTLRPSIRREPQPAPRWLATVCDRLRSDPERRLRVGELAAELGTHPVYLARVFRRRHGCTISQFVHRLRCRRAADLLGAPRATLSAVALQVGSADQAHLCRVFKSQMGVTPRAYRRLVQA